MGCGSHIDFPGYGDTNDYPTSTAATASASLSNSDATFSWTSMQRLVLVQNHPSSATNLYVKINDTTASLTSWDRVLEPGDWLEINAAGMPVVRLAIHSPGSPTYQADFTVQGWK